MLTIVGGPMFAGKTTWLLNYIASLPPQSFQLFKPAFDTRYAASACVSHDGLQLPATQIDHHQPQFKLNRVVNTVLIDELNFFSYDTLWPQFQVLLDQEINLVGAGLLFGSDLQPFGATLQLSTHADNFIQLQASCDFCQQPATNSYRKRQTDQLVVLGASELYGVACDNCWQLTPESHLYQKG